MTTKKFNELFPELKLFVKKVNEMKHSTGYFESIEGINFVFCHAVQKHCLSKKIVIEAIEKVFPKETRLFGNRGDKLLKELGIEE